MSKKETESQNQNQTNHQKSELQRYRTYLLKLSKMKLKHLYLDWDDINKKWSLIVNSKSTEETSKFAVETAHWTIEKYIEDVGWDRELLFMPYKEVISNFKNKKIHAFCGICSIVILNNSELQSHRKKFPEHDGKVSWHHS